MMYKHIRINRDRKWTLAISVPNNNETVNKCVCVCHNQPVDQTIMIMRIVIIMEGVCGRGCGDGERIHETTRRMDASPSPDKERNYMAVFLVCFPYLRNWLRSRKVKLNFTKVMRNFGVSNG